MHKYKVGDRFISRLNGDIRTVTRLAGRDYYVISHNSGSTSTVTEGFIEDHYIPIKKESSMGDFKYEVGDMFAFGAKNARSTRKIVARFTAVNGENRYVIRYFLDGKHDGVDDEIRTEDYIDIHYTKIEPFFEVGKTYNSSLSASLYECVAIDEEVKPKRAWLRTGSFPLYATIAEGDFKYYEEVK